MFQGLVLVNPGPKRSGSSPTAVLVTSPAQALIPTDRRCRARPRLGRDGSQIDSALLACHCSDDWLTLLDRARESPALGQTYKVIGTWKMGDPAISLTLYGASLPQSGIVAAMNRENKLRGGASECDTTSRLPGPEPGRWEGDGRGSQTPVHIDESGAAWLRGRKKRRCRETSDCLLLLPSSCAMIMRS
jgi:hypothetical protein